MKIAVLGAGSVAQAVAFYLSKNSLVKSFICVDKSAENLEKCQKYSGKKGTMCHRDITNKLDLLLTLKRCDGVINTLPYAFLTETTRLCIVSEKHMIDLGGNNNVIANQRCMERLAKDFGVTIVPACGLAPGIISDIAYDAKRILDETEMIKMFCGGLPKHPSGELMHGLFFNEEGLYNEYAEKPEIIIDNSFKIVQFLTPTEDVQFKNPRFSALLESAMTHGAFSPDKKIWGEVKTVFYSTLRYPGHFAKVRGMITKLSREECVRQFKEKLAPAGDDLVALRVLASGNVDGRPAEYACEFVDFCDEKTGLTAMQRSTGFPAAEVALQILENPTKWPKGVVAHEPYVDMQKMRKEMKKMGICVYSSLKLL